MLHSQEKVTGSDQSLLDEYEEAYKNIKDQYKGLRYYDITVTRDDNSVIYDTVINYEKLDMKKLREIEPEIEGQDDIYKNDKYAKNMKIPLSQVSLTIPQTPMRTITQRAPKYGQIPTERSIFSLAE